MIENAVYQLLSESAQKVLETMFFIAPDGVSADPQRPSGQVIAASLTFQGTPPGRFGIVVSDPVGRTLAANFLGVEDETRLLPPQIAEVIGELTNMIAGAVLSELESNANFEIGAPRVVRLGESDVSPDFATGSTSICRFEFPNGTLVLFFAFEDAV
jgi:CheY-specific phosphatase CheX